MSLNNIHIYFEALHLAYKKTRNKEEYTLTFNVFFGKLVDGKSVEKGKESFSFKGGNLSMLQLKAYQAFNNFVDNHKLTQKVAMTSTNVKRCKYRGELVDTSYSSMNPIKVRKHG